MTDDDDDEKKYKKNETFSSGNVQNKTKAYLSVFMERVRQK